VNGLCRNGYSTPLAVSPELFSVIERSLRISTLTGGAFDVTIGPVVRLWRQARKTGGVPDPAELKKAREAVGFRNIVLDPVARTVQLKAPNMQLDFGGIGKGYAADEALAVLNSRGIRRAMIVGGGGLRLGAPPPGKQGWKVALRSSEPSLPGAREYAVLHDVGIETSGDAFQFVEVEGHRYSHIVDPASGMALKDSATVTVVASDGTTADALSTALSVMPLPEGMRVVESIEGASAVIVSRNGTGTKRIVSRRFPKLEGEKQAPSAREPGIR
jgi:thiamine biosynthesis lipoprotein